MQLAWESDLFASPWIPRVQPRVKAQRLTSACKFFSQIPEKKERKIRSWSNPSGYHRISSTSVLVLVSEPCSSVQVTLAHAMRIFRPTVYCTQTLSYAFRLPEPSFSGFCHRWVVFSIKWIALFSTSSHVILGCCRELEVELAGCGFAVLLASVVLYNSALTNIRIFRLFQICGLPDRFVFQITSSIA